MGLTTNLTLEWKNPEADGKLSDDLDLHFFFSKGYIWVYQYSVSY